MASRLLPVRRGFTLVELLVGLATSSIVLLAIGAAFMGFQVAYQRESGVKQSTENARQAAMWIEQYLKLAGYGVNPAVAFDFGNPVPTGSTSKDNMQVAANEVWTDDLAFRFRDPTFLRRGTLAGTALTLDGTSTWGAVFPAGQPVMIGCEGGSYTVGRLSAATTAAGNTATVNAYENLWGGGGSPDLNLVNNAAGTMACAGSTPATKPYVMLLHELRIRIKETNAAAGSDFARRDLVVYRNFNEDVTTSTQYDVIASNVEDFQVAYIMNGPMAPVGEQDSNANWILGDDPTTSPETPNPSSTAPAYANNYVDGPRFTKHPANIRSVRVTIAARGDRMESGQSNQNRRRAFARQCPMENQRDATAYTWCNQPDGFFRSTYTTTVRVPNMVSRTFFVPAILSEGGVTGSNVWGG